MSNIKNVILQFTNFYKKIKNTPQIYFLQVLYKTVGYKKRGKTMNIQPINNTMTRNTINNQISFKDLEDVNHLLQRKMATLGSFSTHKVNYADGYNLLHVFDEAIRQDTISLSLQDEKPVTIAKKPLNISNNKTQGRQYE